MECCECACGRPTNVGEAESATEVALVVASLIARVQQYWSAPEHAP